MSIRLSPGATAAAILLPFALAVLPAPARGQAANWKPAVSWNTYVGGMAYDEVQGVVTNEKGEVFITGKTNSASLLGLSASLPKSGSGEDVFVAKLSENGKSPVWIRVFGGSGEDTGMRVVLGPSGTLYVVGTTKSSSLLTESGAGFVSGSRKGNQDAFLAQVSDSGVLNWFVYLGGANDESGWDVAVEPTSGAVFVAGTTNSNDFPRSVGGRADRPLDDPRDAFVARVDVLAGNVPSHTWSRLIGTSEHDEGYAVAVDGDAVFLGGIVGSNDPKEISVIKSSFQGGTDDAFVARLYAASGGVDWFSYLGGRAGDGSLNSSAKDEVQDILLRPGGELVLVGNTTSSDFPTSIATPSSSWEDAFVVRMTRDGELLRNAAVRVGKSKSELVDAQAVMDARGNIYLGGKTTSSAEFATPNGWDTSLSVNGSYESDGFVTMVDPGVTRILWTSYVGGLGNSAEWVRALSVGPLGQLTIAGHSSAGQELMRAGKEGFRLTVNGGEDGFLFRVDVDSTPPRPGSVTARLEAGRIAASWEGFADEEMGIDGYEWAITATANTDETTAFQQVGSDINTLTASELELQPGTLYYVHVRALNAVGRRSVTVTNSVPVPSTTGGGDGQGQGNNDEEEALSPLGWGCGSTGGDSLMGVLGLVALTLLARRRA